VMRIRLLVFMVLQRSLRALKMSGFRICLIGCGISGACRTNLLIGAMVQFEHKPANRNAVCPDGGECKDSVHRR
jgi:hypothetical protein